MANWAMEFEIIKKSQNPTGSIRRTARFRNAKWNRDEVLERNVLHFGINRTVPAGEKPVFQKMTKRTAADLPSADLDASVVTQVGTILGKDISRFKSFVLDDREQFLVGGNADLTYSEFHFGAGESSIIRMVQEIERAPDNSLILIEEIENGLHPVATRRMVEYLIDIADRKRIQSIFTTHSQDALLSLPSEAIWASIDGQPRQGKLSIETLRAVSGRIDQRLAVFVEDDFARDWLNAILREKLQHRAEEVGVYAVAGDGNAVKTHLAHMANPAIGTKSLCFIDGDSQQAERAAKGIHRFPGNVPESEVFDTIRVDLATQLAILTVSCQRPPEMQAQVRQAVDDVSLTCRDPHLLFNQVGLKIGFVSEVIVKGAFFALWQRLKSAEADRIAAVVLGALGDEAREPAEA